MRVTNLFNSRGLNQKQRFTQQTSRFATAALAGGALAYSNQQIRDKMLFNNRGKMHECATAEEEAAELEKIFKEGGGMMSQEELMELVM